MNKEKHQKLTGATIFLFIGLAAILLSLTMIAGPWWTLLAFGIIVLALGFYIIGKVIDE